ncbi:MAG: DUF4156 domain-containing protein, partial [Woeseia sp.]
MTTPSLKAILLSCLLAGCAASPLLPGGDTVLLSKEAAPEACEFLGEVQGNQGNFWTAEFTSDANLINGARNQMRNAAHALGADYVKIETESLSHNTADHSLGGTYSAVVIGNAYRCGEELLAVR